MSFQEGANAAIKATIGITGTAFSIMLENISLIASIIAALSTAVFMAQQWRNARDKGQAFKEDRDNENS
ncbi:hypothetical protein [Thiohalophilus sp.]|uniref:hypothetical protein n=1 Tax=Thiohalophilus sp. TaxID=3028392 RepID=UPI002ACD29A7|nr:hypothetical protein [Thiohalophilus sp.]MDZ7802364.1 hypothetical protein [Thiohalophilus sp.]